MARSSVGPSSERKRPPLRQRSSSVLREEDADALATNPAASTVSTGRFSSASSSRGWSNAIRTVLQHTEEQRMEQEKDPVGGSLVKIINKHPLFRGGEQETRESEPSLHLSYPLISRQNLRVVQQYLGTLDTTVPLWREVPAATRKSIYCFLRYLFQEQPTLESSLCFLAAVVCTFLIAAASVGHVLIVYSAQVTATLVTYLFFVLLDWEDLQHQCPTVLRNLISRLGDTWHRFDAHILLGQRFVGREWNKADFEWKDPRHAASHDASLWKLPPPSIKQGRRLSLSAEYLARPEWSRETVGHVVAVDFCYVMLREEHLRKQASNARRLATAKASSFSVGVPEDGEGQAPLSPISRRSHSMSTLPPGLTSQDRAITVRDETSSAVVTVMPTSRARRRWSGNTADQSMNSSLGEAYEMRMAANEGSDSAGFGMDSDLAIPGDDANDEVVSFPDRFSGDQSVASDASDAAADLPWIDVGAKIGIRLLNSAHVQRAMTSQETTDRIMNISKDMESKFNSSMDRGRLDSTDAGSTVKGTTRVNFSIGDRCRRDSEARSDIGLAKKPVHSMWTSPAAAAPSHSAQSSLSEHEFTSLVSDITQTTGILQSILPSSVSDRLLPPLSPTAPRNARLSAADASLSRALDSPASLRVTPRNSMDGSLDFPSIDRNNYKSDSAMSSLLHARHSGDSIELTLNTASLGSLDHLAPVLAPVSSFGTESGKPEYKRQPLLPGVKVAVPLFPLQPGKHSHTNRVSNSHFQMGTVLSSKRIDVGRRNDRTLSPSRSRFLTNCLSITVKLDKSFLRNGEFAEMTFRVMDEWGPRYMPKHSKVPVGACVATTFGICILVGWRVEDDSHVMRSLWQRRGPGSAHAYLNRDAIHSTVEAAIGFRVQTKFGWGRVLAYVDGGRTFESGRFFVAITEEGRHNGHVIELNRKDVRSCHGAQFIPVIEHVREAANYQIQLDNYEAALREHRLVMQESEPDHRFWEAWPACLDIMWTSFLKAVDEDKGFDEGVNDFMTSIIAFLDRLDSPSTPDEESEAGQTVLHRCVSNDFEIECIADKQNGTAEEKGQENQDPGFWFMNDILGGLFQTQNKEDNAATDDDSASSVGPGTTSGELRNLSFYQKTYAVLRTLMKTVSIARAASVDHSHFRLALAIGYDFLLFVKTVFKVQQKNVSDQSLEVWKRAIEEIVSTFGPMKERLEKIGQGVAQRMEKQGRRAKVRVLKFVDTILGDERLLLALEHGEWDTCLMRLEIAIIQARVLDEQGLEQYRKIGKFVLDHLQMVMSTDGGAAARNNEKLAFVAQAVQWIASPRRSVLKLLRQNDVLELFERILVRVFYSEELASRMLTIHASNFHSLRHLRLLKDFSVAGRLWMPLLDAADEEFSWVASRMPENTKDFMSPLSSLFSLCVAQFHKIYATGDLSRDWLDFMLEDDAVRIIHDIDMKLILALESFSRDVKEMFLVLPYYPSIDEDILNLMDEVDLDEFLRETSEAIDDPEKLSQFMREKATIAIERFLNYLPKLSIPVEKRDLGEGWVLTCHGEDGGDLTLSDVKIKRENLVCQIMGGDTLFFPMFENDETEIGSAGSSVAQSPIHGGGGSSEESILDHVRELILQAQKYGCWKAGIGGIGQPPTDRYVASVLQGLPVSSVLNCAIELWRSLEIDDDELLEIAIRDVSFQIKLQQDREEMSILSSNLENGADSPQEGIPDVLPSYSYSASTVGTRARDSPSPEGSHRRFNPRVDPTVLFLEMKNLTLHLDNFLFRIEKDESKRTIFDPCFEGCGTLSIHNISIKLRVECAKERAAKKTGLGTDVSTPILQLRELDVGLEKVNLKVRDTGSDWFLNKVVGAFTENITAILEDNLKEQILEQTRIAIENLNSYFLVNPEMMLHILGISMEDLEENVVWV